jgi:DNA topoisomerase I
MSKKLVIVESPAKAKKIATYLGKDYQVEASIGHIRDLPEKNMWVDIVGGFIPNYEISPNKKKRVSELKGFAKNASEIILATDPDREWEAIAWHLAHIFGIDPETAERVTYREITKNAIEEAFSHPAKIDMKLVNAQQSRRILDRIVWYEVSPVLWKKVRPGLSAGRVQSVAVKFLVEREREIRAFNPEESWKITALLEKNTNTLSVELVKIGGKWIKFKTQEDAQEFFHSHGLEMQHLVKTADKKWNLSFTISQNEIFTLQDRETKSWTRLPGAPFTTSTLQQEASRKLGYSVKMTMDIAQRLYQEGHITYMRTDSVSLSDQAIDACKSFIEKEFGKEYSLTGWRKYKTKQANAQEAHEAIRPTYIDKTPETVWLDAMEAKLYKLIWERTVASQMQEAIIETTTYHFSSVSWNDDWIAKWEVIKFAGFMKLYIEWVDDEKDDEEGTKKLPEVAIWESLVSREWRWEQKFTLPPPRYTEASLVKKLESEWIGRPATYAATIQTIQDRWYVVIESKKLIPTDIAFVVTDYLESEFTNFMQYNFTAKVEEEFDQISRGELEWTKMLANFYEPFHKNIESALGAEWRFSGERILGKDSASNRTVLTRMSRFWPVVQIGTQDELGEEEKPRYANLSPGMSIDDISLEEAMKLFSFPKEIGEYDEKKLSIGQGRFGPYVKWGEDFISIPRSEDPHTIDQNRAIELIEAKKTADAPIGMYNDKPYTKWKWRFGPFLKWEDLYINIPRAIDPENITPEAAEKLIAAKVEKEANRYIHNWPEEKISVENGRYGPYIKFGKNNLYLKRDGKKITDTEEIQSLSLEDIKNIILEQMPDAFGKKKAKEKTETKKKAVTKKKK